MEMLTQTDTYITLLMLTLMEIVLGIDNIVFITILCGRLPDEYERHARRAGIAVALISRLGLLFAIDFVRKMETVLFTVPYWEQDFTGRDLVLLGGGIFLIGKATHEIFMNVERPEHEEEQAVEIADMTLGDEEAQAELGKLFGSILVQVIFLDIVFSLDSVITAVGMADELWIMVVAMVVAVTIMLIFAGPVGDFVQRNPSVRILALSFLVLIGVMLTVEGTGGHVSKGYIYSAMGFSLFIEIINLRREKKLARTLSEKREQQTEKFEVDVED
jgi:predicted tellurium resistance membrane protein TerC